MSLTDVRSSLVARFAKLTRRSKVTYASISALLVALVVILITTPGVFSPLTKEQLPKFADSFSTIEMDAQANAICGELISLAPSESELSGLRDNLSELDQVSLANEGREMRKFYLGTSWMVTSNLLGDFELALDAKIDQSLLTIVKSFNRLGIDETNRSWLADLWRSDFTNHVQKVCQLDSELDAVKAQLGEYDTTVNAAIGVAESAPWYPAGYFEITDGLAGKWTTNSGGVDCYGCVYWKMTVVSESGCPGGVYVELNITKDGYSVDWANDSLASLGPGQKGKLVFEAYLDGAGSQYNAEIAESSCHSS